MKDFKRGPIETSIPKGTSKKVLEMLKCRLHVAYAPHFRKKEQHYNVNQLRLLGGVYGCCLKVAIQYYNGRDRNVNWAIFSSHNSTNINAIASSNITTNTSSSTYTANQNRKSLEIHMHAVSEVAEAQFCVHDKQ